MERTGSFHLIASIFLIKVSKELGGNGEKGRNVQELRKKCKAATPANFQSKIETGQDPVGSCQVQRPVCVPVSALYKKSF